MLTALRNGFRIIDEEKIDHWLEVIKSGKSTKEMPFSIRIYNIQLIVPELKRYCLEQYKKHNNILISNFYYTPNSENQCMTYHSDICDIVAMQIEGMKTWHFPLDENTHDYLYDYSKTSVK